MLQHIVAAALRHRGVVAALATLLFGYGLLTAADSKYDVFPEFAAPQAVLQTESPGLAPEQVETLVTQPVENAVNGMPGVESMRSESVEGLSIVTLNFAPGRNIFLDRQAVTERLAGLAGQLPAGVRLPVIAPLTSATGDLMTIGLTSDRLPLMELRAVADWTVRRRLLAVPGVARVSIFGGEVRQFQVQVRPAKLIQYDLSLNDVALAAERATGVRGAGFIDTPAQRIVLQVEGQSLTPQELGRTPLVRESGSLPVDVMLGDIASIVEAPAPPISAATVMGKTGVVINVWAQYQANTLEATRGVDEALAELGPALRAQGIALRPDLFRAAAFVETAVGNIRRSLWLGAGLVVLVLCLFLLDLRTALISCSAIPLSLLAAAVALRWLGLSLNTMTLGGLAIAIGEVVDDAIIDVENIVRRLRVNAESPSPRPAFDVVLDASLEVRSAIVYATFAVCLVFLPVLWLSGLAGRLFAPLGVAYILAVLASLAVALTLTPALCLMLLGGGKLRSSEGALTLWLRARYSALLERVEGRPRAVLAAAGLAVLLGLAVAPFLGGEFLPEFHEGHFIVHVTAAPGASLEESLRIGAKVTSALLGLPFVRSVAQRIGRAAVDDVYGPNTSELEVDLKAGATSETAEAVRRALSSIEGAEFEVNTFLAERIEETLAGYTSPVVIDVFGNDLDEVDRAAGRALELVEKTRGAADARLQAPQGLPRLSVRLRPADLLRWGLDPVTVLEAVSTAYQGRVAGQVYSGDRVVDVSVVLAPSERKQPAELGELRVRNAAGTFVPLKSLADIRLVSGRSAVIHLGARRAQVVTANVEGRDVSSLVAEVKSRLRAIKANGVEFRFEGASAAEERSRRDLSVDSVFAGACIVLLLSLVMGHWRNLALVLLNLPLALVGGVVTVFVFRYNLSVGCLVGFVTLFGITLRNSIMMLAHFEHLVEEEGLPWDNATAIRGASERLVPVLMTAAVTGLGLLPLALGAGAPGREVEGPMALVILGGLATSTALNLLVLPTLALRFARFQTKP